MKIVAIGGGDKTPAIKHALDLTGEERPSVLLIPTASSTEKAYSRKAALTEEFFHGIGVATSMLHEYGEDPSEEKIAHEIGRAALLYTIGGNTPYMLKTMRRHGTDTAISSAIRGGKLHAGTSAGALLPFELAHSNISARPTLEEWDYKYLPTLGLIPGVATAHADQHDKTPHGLRPDSRREALMQTFPDAVDLGYAIDNGAALVINDEAHYAVQADESARVHTIVRDGDKLKTDTL